MLLEGQDIPFPAKASMLPDNNILVSLFPWQTTVVMAATTNNQWMY